MAIFYTSFIPLWFTILFIDGLSIYKNEQNLYTEWISIIVIILGLVLACLLIALTIKHANRLNCKKHKIISATQEKGVTSEFLLSYILPLFTFNFTEWDGVIQFLIYFSILAFLCVRNNNVYANLFFEVANYKFYSCECIWNSEPNTAPIQMMIISKKPLCSYVGNTIETTPLNKPFYLGK